MGPGRYLAAILVFGLVGSAGCKDDGSEDGTPGELGRVAFTYQQSCFFGCPLEQPLLAGTRETIAVTGAGDEEGVTAQSSDEGVAELAIEHACYCERDDEHGGQI